MSITAPQGFRAAGVTAGLKASGNPDLALVVNDGPSKAAAAVFTSNRVAAAPVHWSREVVKDGRVDAVILNSGGANACTGPQGFQNTHTTAEKTAEALGVSATDVFVCSTGLIGEQLPMDKILAGIGAATAALSRRRRTRRRHRDHDHGLRAQAGGLHRHRRRRQGIHHRRHGQGRRHARPGPRHHAGGPHHRRGRPAGHARRRAPRRHPGHLRPGGLGRLHVHQRHRGAARLRRLRRRAVRRRVRRGPDPGLRGTGPQADRRRRGRQPRHRDPHLQRRQRAGRRSGQPRRRPLQPLQGRDLRQGPQLGPRALRRRHHRRRLRARPAQRVHERRADLPQRQHRR